MVGRNPNNQQRAGAFTLVELLVVIGIVAVVISILLPTLSKARKQANAIACVSNLRQWASATQMYVYQNKGWLPRRGNGQQGAPAAGDVQRPEDWFNALPPLLRATAYRDLVAANSIARPPQQSIWICPESLDTTGSNNFFSYAMNMGLSTWFDPNPANASHIGSWTTMILMTDCGGSFCSTWPKADGKGYNPNPRHNGRVNVAFLDGHVASFTGQEVGSNVGVPQRADLRWWSPDSKWPGL